MAGIGLGGEPAQCLLQHRPRFVEPTLPPERLAEVEGHGGGRYLPTALHRPAGQGAACLALGRGHVARLPVNAGFQAVRHQDTPVPVTGLHPHALLRSVQRAQGFVEPAARHLRQREARRHGVAAAIGLAVIDTQRQRALKGLRRRQPLATARQHLALFGRELVGQVLPVRGVGHAGDGRGSRLQGLVRFLETARRRKLGGQDEPGLHGLVVVLAQGGPEDRRRLARRGDRGVVHGQLAERVRQLGPGPAQLRRGWQLRGAGQFHGALQRVGRSLPLPQVPVDPAQDAQELELHLGLAGQLALDAAGGPVDQLPHREPGLALDLGAGVFEQVRQKGRDLLGRGPLALRQAAFRVEPMEVGA